MAEQELVNYIKSALASGGEQGMIRQKLLGVGWPAVDVDEAFFLLKQDGEYAIEDPARKAGNEKGGDASHTVSRPKEILIISIALFAIAAIIYGLHMMKFF